MIILGDAAFRTPQAHDIVARRFDPLQRSIDSAMPITRVMNQNQSAGADHLRGQFEFGPDVLFRVNRIESAAS